MNKISYHIQIKWSENLFLHEMSIESKGDKANVFNSFSEFNQVLHLASTQVTIQGGYDKVAFIVIANTERAPLQYEGRFDLHHFSLQQETSNGQISLKQHMLDFCKYVNKHNMFSEDLKKSATEWLSFLTTR